MGAVGGVEDGLALGKQAGAWPQMDGGGGEQAQAGVVMAMVVPGEEMLAEGAGIAARAAWRRPPPPHAPAPPAPRGQGGGVQALPAEGMAPVAPDWVAASISAKIRRL